MEPDPNQGMFEQGQDRDIPRDSKSITLRTGKRFRNASDNRIVEAFLRYSLEEDTIRAAVSLTAGELDVSENRVEQCLRKAKLQDEAKLIRQQIVEEVYKDKVPILKDITNLSLEKVRKFLHRITDEHIAMMGVKDIKGIFEMGTKCEELLRLTRGEPINTIEVTHSLEETKKAIVELKQRDPIFDYDGVDGGSEPTED